MKKITIFRHDEAHRIIINAINKGQHGNFFLIADVGREELLKELLDIAAHRRVDGSMLICNACMQKRESAADPASACECKVHRKEAIAIGIHTIVASQCTFSAT